MTSIFENEFYRSGLIAAQLRGELTLGQQEELEAWLSGSESRRIWYNELVDEALLAEKVKVFYAADEMSMWDKTQAKVAADQAMADASKDNEWSEGERRGRFSIGKWAAVAAAIMLVFGIWIYNTTRPSGAEDTTAQLANDIDPGSNGATLRMANGKVIELSGKKSGVVIGQDLKYNDGTEVASSSLQGGTAKQSPNTLIAETARGKTYTFTLPDGTKVWLNAASSIAFSSNLLHTSQRVVELSGEAYFEAAIDKNRPFIVKSRGQQVEVLGTHFNINSYEEESAIKTTLLEGSVRVKNDKMEKVLIPGQQSVTAGNNITVKEADVNTVMGWKDGDFIFKGDDFKTAMRSIARWYDVEVVYESGDVEAISLGGFISRKNKLSAIIKWIESTNDIHLKLEGRRLIVTK